MQHRGSIGIVVLGSLCGFRNVSQIHHWAENVRVNFEGEIPNRAYSVLLWAVDTLENGKA